MTFDAWQSAKGSYTQQAIHGHVLNAWRRYGARRFTSGWNGLPFSQEAISTAAISADLFETPANISTIWPATLLPRQQQVVYKYISTTMYDPRV